MFDSPYRHSTIKNTILTFGRMFSNIKIIRQDSAEVGQQVIAVPITYGPKEKIFTRIRQDPDFEQQVMITLPRMAFEITGINYDSSRTGNKNQKIACKKPDGSVLGVFMPVPYNINMTLYAITKGTEDGLDIMEQILPAFMPEYTAHVKTIPYMNIAQVVPFILNSVNINDDYEGDFSTRRLVTTTYDFTAKINMYGLPGNANYITRTDVDINNIDTNNVDASHTSLGDKLTGEIVDFWN